MMYGWGPQATKPDTAAGCTESAPFRPPLNFLHNTQLLWWVAVNLILVQKVSTNKNFTGKLCLKVNSTLTLKVYQERTKVGRMMNCSFCYAQWWFATLAKAQWSVALQTTCDATKSQKSTLWAQTSLQVDNMKLDTLLSQVLKAWHCYRRIFVKNQCIDFNAQHQQQQQQQWMNTRS